MTGRAVQRSSEAGCCSVEISRDVEPAHWGSAACLDFDTACALFPGQAFFGAEPATDLAPPLVALARALPNPVETSALLLPETGLVGLVDAVAVIGFPKCPAAGACVVMIGSVASSQQSEHGDG
jgi:hypothetical protein